MNYLYNSYNRTNERLLSGIFPDESLYFALPPTPKPIDLKEVSANGIEFIKKTHDFFLNYIMYIRRNVDSDLITLSNEEIPLDVNVLINTGYMPNEIENLKKTAEQSGVLCPYVTELDKALWLMIFYFHMVSFMGNQAEEEFYIELMYGALRVFKSIQKRELKYGYTINLDAFNGKSHELLWNILKSNHWETIDHKYLTNLSENEKVRYKKLFTRRKELHKQVVVEFENQKKKAKKTNAEWFMLLRLVNELSELECQVIDTIVNADESEEKLKCINNYHELIKGILNGVYISNTHNLKYYKILNSVQNRIFEAPAFCTAGTITESWFSVNNALFFLAYSPITFNYLLMLFHRFRIEPNEATAKDFVGVALAIVKRNLRMDNPDNEVFDFVLEKGIVEFTDIVAEFVRDNKEYIQKLSFNMIQSDAVLPAGFVIYDKQRKFDEDFICDYFDICLQSDKWLNEIQNIINGDYSRSKIESSVIKTELENALSEKDKTVIATQAILSLNVVYMMSLALAIMLNNKQANIHFENCDAINKCRVNLRNIDQELIRKVYSNLDEQEVGMPECREIRGIDPSLLSEREKSTENAKCNVLYDAFDSFITEIADEIELKNIDEIMAANDQIREKIYTWPECREKERYIARAELIIEMLCKALVSNCKKNEEFEIHRSELLSSLGREAKVLKEDIIDSLATANFLYKQYASMEYGREGFDFSCISALYYQAFEDAYNDLIWEGYANKLKKLKIGGRKFTDIIVKYEYNLDDCPGAIGYLYINHDDRCYYARYNGKGPKRKVKIVEKCMYFSFSKIMENVTGKRKIDVLDKFCDYFAEITGFDSKEEMQDDEEFMKICNRFTENVCTASPNRNGASHGGTKIDLEQCRNDKMIILNDLEEVKSDSIGLIQELIYLMTKNKSNN